MSRAARFWFGATVALSLLSQEPSIGAAPVARSISTSRQFIVYGSDARLRGAICELAERTKADALATLRLPDAWRMPLVINAQLPQAAAPELPPARLNVSQTGFGLKLQLDLTIGADVSAPAVQRELLRATLLEMAYREQPETPAGTSFVEPPAWLIEGILALAGARDSSAVAERLERALGSGRIIALEDFLAQKPTMLDSPSRDLYAAYAAAFVSMLTQGADSRTQLARFLSDLPRMGSDAWADLQAHFPALAEGHEITHGIWKGSIMRLAARDRYRSLTCEETERELAQILQVDVSLGGKPTATFSLEEFPRFVGEPDAGMPLRRLAERLLLLAPRAHALYQPVIAEYQQIAMLLQRRKTNRIPQRLAEARGMREQLTRRMSAIGDYLNWHEATQSRTASGVFREYLKAAELASERVSRRHDPISVYLDAMEAQF